MPQSNRGFREKNRDGSFPDRSPNFSFLPRAFFFPTIVMQLFVALFSVFMLLGGVSAGRGEVPPSPGAALPEKTSIPPTVPFTAGPIITDIAVPQATGTASLQIAGFFAITGGNFSPTWRRVSAGGDYFSLTLPVIFYYGIAPHTEIQIFTWYHQNWASNVGPASQSANFGGIGDSGLLLKYLFVEEQKKIPAVAGILIVGFPTGHHRHLNSRLLGIDQLGRGAYSITVGIDLFKYVKPLLLYGNIWYTGFTDATVNGQRVYYPDQIILNGAVEWPLTKRWVFLLELVSIWDGGRLIGSRDNQPATAIVSVLPAIEFLPTTWFNIAFGLKVDLVGKNTPYTFSPVVNVFLNF